MRDEDKTREQLIDELMTELRQRNATSEVRSADTIYRQVWGTYLQSTIPTLILSREGKIVDYNAAMAELTGYAHEEVPDINGWMSKIYPDKEYRNRVIEISKRSRQREVDIKRDEFVITGKDGEERCVQFSVYDILHEGKPIDLQVIQAEDITERKKMEKAMRESKEQYRSLFENMHNGFAHHKIMVDESGKPIDYVFLEVNHAFEKLTGLRKEDIIGKKVTEVIPDIKESEYDWIGNYGEVTLTGKVITFEQYSEHLERWYSVCAYSSESGYFTTLFHDITERKQAEKELQKALSEIHTLKERLEAENVYLREEIRSAHLHGDMVGQSHAMKVVMAQAEQVAGTDSTVLILGETGTGKELLAHAIHNMSPRRDRSLVIVNCAAMPSALVENELFGREKGAYTGALTKQIGRFEVANGSTIFLDEIGELPPQVQVKLLRFLQSGQFERLGSTETITVDVRIIAATNRDLGNDVQEGRFREDLFYRINVFPIAIPPLRERTEDIPPLVWAFVNEFNEKMGKKIESISRQSMDALQSYSWPGNVRELRNIIERAMIQTRGSALRVQIPGRASGPSVSGETLADVEFQHISDVLERTGWRVRGKNGAAEILGLKPSTLESRMAKLGIRRPERHPR